MARRTEALRPHTFRTTDEQWDDANNAATYNNEDLSPVIRRLLDEYIRQTNSRRTRDERTGARLDARLSKTD